MFCQLRNRPCSLLSIILASIGGLTLCLTATSAQNGSQISIDSFVEIDPCFTQAVYSFLYPSSYPPTTVDALKASCKYQQDGFKCLKEKSKTAQALVKRGLTTFLQTRQRFNKKYCTNVNSEASKKHISDMKCIMEKKVELYKQLDSDLLSELHEIKRRNYADSAIELKYICCSLVGHRRSIIENAGPECLASKAGVEEMITSIVTNDINLICDDEEKLTLKVCPALEPLKPPRGAEKKFGPSALILYLVLTLGEPDKMLT